MEPIPEDADPWAAGMRTRMQSHAPGLGVVRARPAARGEGVVILVVRDEITHLPGFLRHHRAAGVRHFAVVDNGSTDGTVEYLLAQQDCDVFRHRGDYRDSAAGAVWRNLLIGRYAEAGWWLCPDADELTVYPGWPRASLDEAAAAYRASGLRAVTALMVEMYGAGPVLETRLGTDGDLLAACPLFDGEGYTFDRPAGPAAADFPRLNIRGGPEMRAIRPRPDYGWLAKTPLLLEPGLLLRDPHTAWPFALNLELPRLGLLHVRFFDHLLPKVERMRARQGHTPGSIHAYEQLVERLAREPGFSFAYAGSRRFSSWEQLAALGLVHGDRGTRRWPAAPR